MIGQAVSRRPRAWTGRGFAWLVGLTVGALLPFAPMTPTTPAHADPPVFEGEEIKNFCVITSSGQSCPVFSSPPGLLNAGALAAAGPEIEASLHALEEQAIEDTLADFQLPDSDRNAVLAWGRADAQTRLWGLIVEAIDTPAADRTADQANAVTWMGRLASAQTNDSAMHAGAEYATWAGLDVDAYWKLARNQSTTSGALTTFLSQDVRARSPENTPRGGYCRYKPPDPYSAQYDGSQTTTCFAACPSITGCPVPTPTYAEFVRWGQAAATYGNLTDPGFVTQAMWIANAASFGAAVVGAGLAAGLVVTSGIGTWFAGTAVAAAIFPYAFGTGAVANGLVGATTASVAATPAAVVVVVILAVLIATLEGIRVADNAQLPGKVADLVVNARSTVSDPATLIGTTDGATTLFNLFVGATLPRPRNDVACDNSLIAPSAYTSSPDPLVPLYVPLGSNQAIISLVDRRGCLNPPPIPPASDTDPHFLVQQGPLGPNPPAPQVSPTIGLLDPDSGITQTVRISGNWFIKKWGQSPGEAGQSLRLTYTDWDGVVNVASLMRDPSGNYVFVGTEADDDPSTTVDADTCEDDGTCWVASTIEYVGPDGNQYSASVEGFAAATGTPTYSPSSPVEASPVTFDAADFAPGGADGELTYSWRFQQLGCGWIECVLAGQHNPDGTAIPSYDGPFPGKTASYTWESIGPAKVELTASDQHGHTATTVFVVNVGNVAPTVVAQQEYEARVGVPVNVQGTFGDAGKDDDLNALITFGDGQQQSIKAGPHGFNVVVPGLPHLQQLPPRDWSVTAEHAYNEPGIYYGTIAVSDWGGGTDFDSFVVRVTGAQSVTFPAVEDHAYGDQVTMDATGTLSGQPVTYTAGPAEVCTPSGENGERINLVGVGSCTVTADQAANLPLFLAATPVERTFDVTPAGLTITADDRTKVYGAPDPTFTASYDGLVNGDTEDDFPDLALAGPPTGADVGTYDITPSGATNPSYDIDYVAGTQTITRAPLTITADDKTKVYGADDPDLTASYDGLVNDDVNADITGLVISGPPSDADVGAYDLTPSGATSPNYDIDYVIGTQTITRAPLTITADDKSKVYGADDPVFTASYDGLVNGDTRDDVHGLVLTGAPSDSHVGTYPIEASGATNPNYDVELVDGAETVTPAPLTIRADDKAKVYGAEDPLFTASYVGLVNGDIERDVHGLTISGAPTRAGVGQYLIKPSGAANPDYDITFADGTETITPAPLSIRPQDVTVASGRVPFSYPWTGKGWVNDDSDATLAIAPNRLPSCSAQASGVPVTSNAAPGVYPAAITCSGAVDHNYEISYGSATLTVDPTISLRQLGLPETVGHKAYLDRSPVALPIVARQVGYGTRHTFRFPTVVLGGDGTTYVTSGFRHDGQVTQNIDVTASYLTMRQVVRRAAGEQAIGQREAKRLLSRWQDLESHIAAHRNADALTALRQFADGVRDQTGGRIRAAAAQDLLAYARAVYQRIGGSGAI